MAHSLDNASLERVFFLNLAHIPINHVYYFLSQCMNVCNNSQSAPKQPSLLLPKYVRILVALYIPIKPDPVFIHQSFSRYIYI